MKIASSQRQVRVIVACVAGVLKGKGKGVLGKGVLGARETPFPFPSKHLPRRLELQRVRLPGVDIQKPSIVFYQCPTALFAIQHIVADEEGRKKGRVQYVYFNDLFNVRCNATRCIFTCGKKGVTKPHLISSKGVVNSFCI